jgi:hypothetical protein
MTSSAVTVQLHRQLALTPAKEKMPGSAFKNAM